MPSRIEAEVAGGRHRRGDVAGPAGRGCRRCGRPGRRRSGRTTRRKSSGVPMTTTTSASPLSIPRVRENASSWSAGRQPRPRPLMNVGTRSASTQRAQRVPGAVPVHVGAGDQHGALGAGDERGGPGDVVGVGLERRRDDGRGRRRSAEANTTSSGKSRNTGPRCGVSAAVTAACTIVGDVGGRRHRAGELRDRARRPARGRTLAASPSPTGPAGPGRRARRGASR